MTKEESIAMWQLEKQSLNQLEDSMIPDGMKQLYSMVDTLIVDGKLMYNTFVSDMIDATTDMIVRRKDEADKLDRSAQVTEICNKLYEKYKEQYNNEESGEGNPGVLADTAEVQDESGVCEPECIEGASREHTEEVK